MRLRSAFGAPFAHAPSGRMPIARPPIACLLAACLFCGACATAPPSLATASLRSMPADADVAVAARVPPMRGPLADGVDALGVPIPSWLHERVVEVRAGLHAGTRPGFLIWIQGQNLDAGMRARLLLSPDWFYFGQPFPHFRSVDAAALLPGDDVLVLTNLPLDRVLDAFGAAAFPLPAPMAPAEGTADLLLIVPDLTIALAGLAAASELDRLTDRLGTDNLWLSGVAAADGLVVSAVVGAGDARLALLLERFGGRAPALAELRMQAQGESLTLAGLMPYEQLIGIALLVLGPGLGIESDGTEGSP